MKSPFISHLYKLENFENWKEKEHQLIQIDEKTFQIIEYGKFKPILSNGCIMEDELANLLYEVVPEQIEYYKKIDIYRKATNEKWSNYNLIIFKNNLGIENFESANAKGLKIYSFMYSLIYLSLELKSVIEKKYSNLDKITFINEKPLIA